MKQLILIVWLFPTLFMLHDFEEIILVMAWKTHSPASRHSFHRKKLFGDAQDTASFSIGVAIEFLILSLCAFLSCLFHWYLLWFGLFFAFTIHLLGHCVIAVLLRQPVPGVWTSVLFLPLSSYLLAASIPLFPASLPELLIFCLLGILIMLIMLRILHRCMGCFARWIKKIAGINSSNWK